MRDDDSEKNRRRERYEVRDDDAVIGQNSYFFRKQKAMDTRHRSGKNLNNTAKTRLQSNHRIGQRSSDRNGFSFLISILTIFGFRVQFEVRT